MTPELETLRRLHEAATPEPWLPSVHSESVWNPRIEREESRRFWPVWVVHHDEATTIRVEDRIGFKSALADAKLIATLRNLAPELIALLEAVEVLCNPPKDCPATCLDQVAVVRDCNEWLRAKLREVKP